MNSSHWAVFVLCALTAEGSRPALSENVVANVTFITAQSQAREYELPKGEEKQFSKVMLIFVTSLGLGCCGVDHCIAGQTHLGVLKCCTCGGGLWWWIIDWCFIIHCCLTKGQQLHQFGWNLEFRPSTVDDAYTMSICTAVLQGPMIAITICSLLKGLVSKAGGNTPATNAQVTALAVLRSKGILSNVPTEFEINHVFGQFDGDKDGFINEDELKAGLETLGIKDITDEKIKALIKASDGNKDDKLTKDELADLLIKEGAILAPPKKEETTS